MKDPVVSFQFIHAKGDEQTKSTTNVEHSYMTHESTPWMPVMLQFAAFLEGCGYVGVYERVHYMIDTMDDDK